MPELLFKEEAYAIAGAAIEVHKELGPGFSEPVYQEAMEIELADRHIPYDAQHGLTISYKRRVLKKRYVPDLPLLRQDHRRDQSPRSPIE